MNTLTTTAPTPQLSNAQQIALNLQRLEVEAWNDTIISIAKKKFGLIAKPKSLAYRCALISGLGGNVLGSIGVDISGIVYYFRKSRPNATEAGSLTQALGLLLQAEAPRCYL